MQDWVERKALEEQRQRQLRIDGASALWDELLDAMQAACESFIVHYKRDLKYKRDDDTFTASLTISANRVDQFMEKLNSIEVRVQRGQSRLPESIVVEKVDSALRTVYPFSIDATSLRIGENPPMTSDQASKAILDPLFFEKNGKAR